VRVIYDGVDLAAFRPDTAARDPQLVLAVGRLVAKKGFSDLIEACRLLRERGRAFRCRIVGEGPLRASLESQAADLSDVVEFAGASSQEDLAAEYRQASVFVLPAAIPPDGNTDALPTVLLEAMASGCAIVSTRVAGIPEIVDHEENGLLVEPADVPALTAAIERLLADPQLRARFGVAARLKAESRFDVMKNAAELYRSFTRAVTVERSLQP
jgi:glycosyltransferase involved in cell wall biosynthesis